MCLHCLKADYGLRPAVLEQGGNFVPEVTFGNVYRQLSQAGGEECAAGIQRIEARDVAKSPIVQASTMKK